MAMKTRDRSLGDGVYFADSDYIGFSPRIMILLVDSICVLAIWFLVAAAFAYFNLVGTYDRLLFTFIFAATWFYLVPLKRSRFRTVGYKLVGAKLVTLRGEKPSLLMLTFREMMWLFGPIGLIIDLVFCGIDSDSQTLRDRFTNMCLVKNSSQPIGRGEIHLAYTNMMGYSFALPRVSRILAQR